MSSGQPPLQTQPAGLKVCDGVGLRQLDPPRAPWFAQPRAMVTLGAEGGYGRARRSQQREGGERGGRRAGTVSPTSVPREAAQPPEPRKTPTSSYSFEEGGSAGLRDSVRLQEEPRPHGDPSRSTFLPVSLRYPGTRRGEREGQRRRASPCLDVRPWMRMEPWGEAGNSWSSSSATQGVCLRQLLLGLAPPRKQPPTLHPKMFVFLGKGEGWHRLLTFVLKDGS